MNPDRLEVENAVIEHNQESDTPLILQETSSAAFKLLHDIDPEDLNILGCLITNYLVTGDCKLDIDDDFDGDQIAFDKWCAVLAKYDDFIEQVIHEQYFMHNIGALAIQCYFEGTHNLVAGK